MFLNFIGLVCVSLCSLCLSNYREIDNSRESGVSITSNVIMETKVSKPTLNMGATEERGYIDFFLTENDLISGELIETFILNLPSTLNIGFDASTLGSSSWTTNSAFYDYSSGYVDGGIYACNLVTLDKTGYTEYSVGGHQFSEQTYVFTWKYNSTNVLVNTYTFLVPLYYAVRDYAYDLGISLEAVTSNSSIGSHYVYYETANSNYSYPFITYLYIPYYKTNSAYYNQGYENGKSVGFQEGVQHALDNYNYDATATTIFTGITSIALVPIDMFLRIFNFEILGINVAGLVTGILTMAVIIIVIRMITGNKND